MARLAIVGVGRIGGEVAYLTERGRMRRDAAGAPAILSGVTWDVTERRKAEEELRKRWKPEAAPALEAYIAQLATLPALTPAVLEATFNAVLQQHGLKIGQLMPLYRLFVAGRMQGPGMFDVSALLGRDEVMARLNAGLQHCRAWA